MKISHDQVITARGILSTVRDSLTGTRFDNLLDKDLRINQFKSSGMEGTAEQNPTSVQSHESEIFEP